MFLISLIPAQTEPHICLPSPTQTVSHKGHQDD
jgi:hypothetical protein